jgi:hypothetical protein
MIDLTGCGEEMEMEDIHPDTLISRILNLCENRGISKGIRDALKSQILPLHLTRGTEDESAAISIACRIAEWGGICIWEEMLDREIEFFCKAFDSEGVKLHRISVSISGCVRVWDDVAGHYTIRHSVGKQTQQKIRKIAWKK